MSAPTLEQVERMWLKAFTKPSERTLQTKLGPSEVGGCPYCVGYTMAAKLCDMPSREIDPFGYAAHIGTMCHYYLENKLDLAYGAGYDIESFREQKLEDIFEVPGYGEIGGSCDLYIPDWERTFDYKFPGKYSYEKVCRAIKRGDGPSMQYRGQQQVYRKGWQNLDRPVSSSVIIFLPRHTNSLNDVVFWEEPNNDELFDKAVERSELIWMFVQDGQLGEIPSDPDCYQCDRHGRGDLTNYNAQHANTQKLGAIA